MYDRNYKMRKEKIHLLEKFTCVDTYRRTAQITYPHPNRESSIYLPSSKCISVSDPHPKKEKKG